MRTAPEVTVLFFLLACAGKTPPADSPTPRELVPLRVATYNSSLFGDAAGETAEKVQDAGDRQVERILTVITETSPDILVLQELDYDATGATLENLNGHLDRPYPYLLQLPSNTGVGTGLDMDNDGESDGPGDAQGYGTFEGQYGFAILSRYPIDEAKLRAYQNLLWKDMPDARLPTLDGEAWYTEDELAVLRLSSKNHVAVPIDVDGETLHIVIAHPTPPVFDGDEDRNGMRNADEIRLLGEILSGADWLVDDAGVAGGLAESDHAVVFGDMNADPVDGDALDGAIQQLLEDPRIHPDTATGSLVPSSDGGESLDSRPDDAGDPAHDTASWGQRVDYVLPTRELTVKASAVHWPTGDRSVEGSDHRLVWVDLEI
ncbi:MAG: endonuclease/exonuclease/phosphatase family metal-dependent hydrolase [Cognaticolwellia sp.]|jgi:endonuclease/exonuclease/phosphatase family metal-dependent hydrolase